MSTDNSPQPAGFVSRALEKGPLGVFAWWPDGRIEKVSPHSGFFSQASISPNGDNVVYWGGDSGRVGVWRTDLATGTTARFTDSSIGAWHPSYSQDGSLIAFASDMNSSGGPLLYEHEAIVRLTPYVSDNDEAHIYVMNPDGLSPRQITEGPFYDGRPSISPDRTRVAFSSNRSGQSETWVVPVDGSAEPAQLVPGLQAFRPWWTIDGESIVCLTRSTLGTTLVLVHLESGTHAPLETEPTSGMTNGPFTTFDGKCVLAHSNRNGNMQLFRISLTDREAECFMPSGFSEAMHVTQASNGVMAFDSTESAWPDRFRAHPDTH